MSRPAILGTIVIERVVDAFVVVAIASIAILVLSVRGIVASAVLVGLAVTALLVVIVAAGIAAHRLPGAGRVAAFLDRWPRVRASLARLREGLAVASDVRTVGLAVALSLASWSCTVLAFAAAARQSASSRRSGRPRCWPPARTSPPRSRPGRGTSGRSSSP